MAASPEMTSTHVPGSGTSPSPPPLPHGSPFPFLPVLTGAPPVPFFFFPTPQTLGSGGGAIGTQVPLPNGSYRPNGGAGPNPGNAGRFSNADSKGSGGPATAEHTIGAEDERLDFNGDKTVRAEVQRPLLFGRERKIAEMVRAETHGDDLVGAEVMNPGMRQRPFDDADDVVGGKKAD